MPSQLELFDAKFRSLHQRSANAVLQVPNDRLFWKPEPNSPGLAAFSFGENILRSAAAVEQTFGGITARLWDDPFEWTLPEELSTTAKIGDYLNEVEETRKKGFRFFGSDEELLKQIPAPEELRSIFEILLDTLARAEHFHGRAMAIFQLFSGPAIPPP